MTTTERPKPGQTLLASAQRITRESIVKDTRRGRKAIAPKPWQEDSWDMYDLVGEQRFLSTTLAARMAQAKLFVGKVETPGADPVPVEDEQEVTDLLEAIGATAAGRGQLTYRLGVNMFVAGEGWLIGIPPWYLDEDVEPFDDVQPEEYDWRMLSISEVKINPADGKVTLAVSGDEQEAITADPDDLKLIRVWRPHPRRWWEADSPTRASLPVLRELVGLTMHISAQVDSRLAGAGLLIIPQSAQRALQVAAGLEENSASDQFTEALIEAMLTPINDRGSASALVPLVVTVPDDAVDKFNYLTFSKPLDTEARNLRDDAIRRLAMGQDAPPELLLGTAGMNHWGGWLVQEETVSSHIEPPLALICDALTVQYLRPTLIDAGIKSEEEAEQYVVWYDVSHMIVRPNRSADAKDLHTRGAIGDEALRRETGFDESDAPAIPLDQAQSIVLEMIRANPDLAVTPGVPVLLASIRQLLDNEAGTDEDVAAARDAAAAAAEAEREAAEQPAEGSDGESTMPETGGDTDAEPPGFASTHDVVLQNVDPETARLLTGAPR